MKLFSIFLIFILLASNVLTLTWGAFNTALSGGFAAISGVETLAQKRKKTVKKYGAKIISRTIKTSQRSLASIPLESVPYIGIAALLTMTALELKTACDNINDIDSMNASMGLEKAEIFDSVDIRGVCNPEIPSLDSLLDGVSGDEK